MLTFPLDHALARVDKLCKSLQSSSEEPTEGTQLYHTRLITCTGSGLRSKRLPIGGRIRQRVERAVKPLGESRTWDACCSDPRLTWHFGEVLDQSGLGAGVLIQCELW